MAGKRTKQAVVAAGENGHRRALVMIGKANVTDDKPIVTEKADKSIAWLTPLANESHQALNGKTHFHFLQVLLAVDKSQFWVPFALFLGSQAITFLLGLKFWGLHLKWYSIVNLQIIWLAILFWVSFFLGVLSWSFSYGFILWFHPIFFVRLLFSWLLYMLFRRFLPVSALK